MALAVIGLSRVFTLKSRGRDLTLDDLNPKASPEEIKRLYCDQYPELSSATVTGPKVEKDGMVYEFTPKAGTKG